MNAFNVVTSILAVFQAASALSTSNSTSGNVQDLAKKNLQVLFPFRMPSEVSSEDKLRRFDSKAAFNRYCYSFLYRAVGNAKEVDETKLADKLTPLCRTGSKDLHAESHMCNQWAADLYAAVDAKVSGTHRAKGPKSYGEWCTEVFNDQQKSLGILTADFQPEPTHAVGKEVQKQETQPVAKAEAKPEVKKAALKVKASEPAPKAEAKPEATKAALKVKASKPAPKPEVKAPQPQVKAPQPAPKQIWARKSQPSAKNQVPPQPVEPLRDVIKADVEGIAIAKQAAALKNYQADLDMADDDITKAMSAADKLSKDH
eukprot:gnl/TRDRNA2_/TRDRNA2_180507_c0_seq1.p1 gnl/TRDRNA2_/TRDRNA2_180507_c0~~gnl/TRDRNA2_/TRDRNA2_180507_c0_seq1.p1  ORF type:complete len:315 (-),score=91.27 gnl/TRDRNA2_/TRDRNA2_180507_c0_seq1:106-1050(-)